MSSKTNQRQPAAIVRKRRGLNFCEPGTFVAQGEQLRKKARLEALQKRIAATAAKTGIAEAAKLANLSTNKVIDSEKKQAPAESADEDVPEVEWWDKPILKNRSLDDIMRTNAQPEDLFDGITNLVEHPPIKKPPGPDPSKAQVPIFLTKKERKKLRRQNRKNLELEKQEQIKLGLMPKPEPKLKRSNVMYALGNEALVNPSAVEMMVREQEEKRKQAHIEHNEAKKLTLEEKRAKKLRKVQEDLTTVGIWVSVFRVLTMNSQSHIFKVTQNARQLTMTGVLAIHKDINLVVVEGGPKQQRKFKHLMMDRIKWEEDPILKSENSTNPIGTNQCSLIWEGQINRRSFRGFKVEKINDSSEMRKFFQQHRVEQYWDLAFKMSVLETISDTQ